MRNLAFGVLALAAAAASTPAAAVTSYVNMTFESGAIFTGTVDWMPDYSHVTGVSGTLKGYAEGAFIFSSLADSSYVNWVWTLGTDYAASPDVFSTFLMSGTEPSFGSFVVFSVNTAGAPALTLQDDTYHNSVNYTDLMVSGSISDVAPGVPEPAAWALMIAGFGLTGIGLRRRSAAHA